MISRHRQQPFKSPFTPEEIELDPEKGLWIPGRKTICIPAPKMPSYGIDWSSDMGFLRPTERQITLAAFRDMFLSFSHDPICVPGRSEYLAQPRDLRIPVTYNDIRRSERPAWRSSRVLYDRYERMIQD